MPTIPGPSPPTAVRGDGVRLYDAEGREYLDGSSGAVAASLGHGDERIAAVIAEQAARLAFAHRTQFRNQPAERLGQLLAEVAPPGLHWSLLVNGGSEAVEASIKLALAHWRARGHPDKTHVVSRWMSYHGSTLGALSATGHPGRRRAAAALLHPFPALHPPNSYRCPVGRSAGGCGADCADELDAALVRLGPERVAAFVAEPITGASSAALTPGAGYYERVREICDRHSVLWIADEVMTGFGRTGRWFAVEHWRAIPDLIAFGKGASGGYMPLGGVLVSDSLLAPILEREGYVGFGHTYTNTPLPAAVGAAVIERIAEERLVERAAQLGERLEAGLRGLATRHAPIGDVRGRGLLWGVELVADRKTRAPAPPAEGLTRRLLESCRRQGLILYGAAGCIDGVSGDAVMVAPPLAATEADVAELLERLDRGLASMAAP